MLSDIEIAQQVKMQPVTEIAEKLGIDQDDLELYGKYKAKLSYDLIRKVEDRKPGKLVLVTAITPTLAGEGKSTTTVGLAQGLQKIGKKVIVALREPSLGPCFGIKGGAAGGGYSQVVPMEDINLHFTGDFHAITSAHMLLSAMLDNSIQQGNPLNIDPRRIIWKRVVDMNDRALRNIVIGLGGGSSIDGAKAIAMMAPNEGNYWDYIYGGTGGGQKLKNKPLPIVAIPTTAVDTTGAGDTFEGFFLSRIAAGCAEEDALLYAAQAASS